MYVITTIEGYYSFGFEDDDNFEKHSHVHYVRLTSILHDRFNDAIKFLDSIKVDLDYNDYDEMNILSFRLYYKKCEGITAKHDLEQIKLDLMCAYVIIKSIAESFDLYEY